MTPRRTVLLTLLATAIAVAFAIRLPGSSDGASSPPVEILHTRTAPLPGNPLSERLVEVWNARQRGDLTALTALLDGDDVAAYEAALTLAKHPDTPPTQRYEALRRVAALRIDEPLARNEIRELHLATGAAAEAAGLPNAAIDAYVAALPDTEARAALTRLQTDPYAVANAFLDARLHQAALDALNDAGVSAASIEAPALRALGRYEDAIVAYRAWLDEDPNSRTARFGIAWSQWYLGNLDAAEALFTQLGGPDAEYALGLIANRRGDLDAAVRHLVASESASRLWLATTLLERAQRWSDATDVYLRIAEGTSAYADDAAWRARLLASELGDAERAGLADDLLPRDSYFSLLLGREPNLPSRDDVAPVSSTAITTADWLSGQGDTATARLVLAFALRDATDEATIIALGEALLALDEYRLPQRAGSALIADGSEQVRAWRLAYPRAWPDLVERRAMDADVDPNLAWAVMRRESAFFPDAISRSGAQGLMQVMPTTWDWLAELQAESPADPFTVADNVRYGVHYLGWLFSYFDGDEELVVASYNRGQGYIGRLFEEPDVAGDKNELYRYIDALETREYLQNVLLTRHVYQRLDDLEARRAAR